MTETQSTYGAAILAGGGPDKLAGKRGVPHKALIPLNGKRIIDYVLQAFERVRNLERTIVVAQADGALGHLNTETEVVETEGDSFVETIETGAEAMPEVDRLIVCTCDVPMIEPEAVSHFINSCGNSPRADVAWAIIKENTFEEQFPGARRTFANLKEAKFTGGGLAMMSKTFIANNYERLKDAYARRKNIFALANLLGWRFVVTLLLGRLSLVSVLKRAEELLGCHAVAVISPYPSVAYDVDSLEHLATAREWAQGDE